MPSLPRLRRAPWRCFITCRQCSRWAACGLALWAQVACGPAGKPWSPPAEGGKDVAFGEGLAVTLPATFHEVTGTSGRTFRERGTGEESFATIHIEEIRTGMPVPLDEAFALVLGRLRGQQRMDLLDEQLRFVGRELALSYVAEVTLLDVPRRQWGVLVGRPEGLVGLFLTAPAGRFAGSALDFQGALDSLRAP